MRSEPDVRDSAVTPFHRELDETDVRSDMARATRGVVLLEAMNDGDLAVMATCLTNDVHMTSFDRGEIHEARGREEVCRRLAQLAEMAAGSFVPTGSREAEDAVFYWGGSSKSERPGWMITLFFRKSRFFDVRLYLLR